MADFYFTTDTTWKGYLIEDVSGGLATLAGIYVWEKLMGPVQNWLGPYLKGAAGPVTAFILSLIILYIGRRVEGWFGKFLIAMGFAMFGDSIAKVFGLDPIYVALTPQETPAYVSKWSTLEPVPLTG